MPIFRKENDLILFMHIPKTGGTSVEIAFQKAQYEILFRINKKLDAALCSPQHFQANVIMELFNSSDMFRYSFAVVRNPLDRLISEYKHRLLADKSTPSFEEWVKQTFLLYKRNNYLYDNHIRPQAEFITDSIEIFKFEEGINNILSSIFKKLSISHDLQSSLHLNKSIDAEINVNEETLNLIKEFYDVDYNKFKY